MKSSENGNKCFEYESKIKIVEKKLIEKHWMTHLFGQLIAPIPVIFEFVVDAKMFYNAHSNSQSVGAWFHFIYVYTQYISEIRYRVCAERQV